MPENERADTSVLTTLFGHNLWANLKLLDFCEHLSYAQLDATAIGGFGSIRDSLVHIVSAEVDYVNLVTDKLPAVPLPSEQFLGFEVLRVGVRWATSCFSWHYLRGLTRSSGWSARKSRFMNTSSPVSWFRYSTIRPSTGRKSQPLSLNWV